jgi:hypothetical protein
MPGRPVSPYLSSPTRTLYDACREIGRDRHGTFCPICHVKSICEADRSRHDDKALKDETVRPPT